MYVLRPVVGCQAMKEILLAGAARRWKLTARFFGDAVGGLPLLHVAHARQLTST